MVEPRLDGSSLTSFLGRLELFGRGAWELFREDSWVSGLLIGSGHSGGFTAAGRVRIRGGLGTRLEPPSDLAIGVTVDTSGNIIVGIRMHRLSVAQRGSEGLTVGKWAAGERHDCMY